MNVTFAYVFWICVFVLKVFGLIDLTWWVVGPLAFMAAMCMMSDRK